MSEGEEPLEAEAEPLTAEAEAEVQTSSTHTGQRLVSTQTITHEYLTQSGRVMRETITSGADVTVLDFIYDESGRPFALKYTEGSAEPEIYYYILNLQGDVIGLTNSSGSFVAQYTYDAWGNILTATGAMAKVNPLRYRGYYYDTETGFYYLQSRYYDPVNHRFINADVYASTDSSDAISCNMFAYCGNNPVIASDESGEFWHIVIGVVVGVVSQYVSDVVSNVLEGKTGVDILKPTSSIVDYVASGASGALAATGIGLAGSVVSNTAISGTAYLANSIIDGNDPTFAEFAIAAGTGLVSGFIGGSGVDGNHIKGVWNTSKDVLATAVSSKKIAMYTAKIAMCKKTIVVGTLRTAASIVASNVAGEIVYSE